MLRSTRDFLRLFSATLCSDIILAAKVDNTQAISVVRKCYFKKLTFLERTHKCSIGSVNELINSGQLAVDYAPTLAHRRDRFTKYLLLSHFLEARKMMSMVLTS